MWKGLFFKWFWAKVLHCARTAPDVFKQQNNELTDYIPYVLTGEIVPGLCAAGHKGTVRNEWIADEEFLAAIDPCLPFWSITWAGSL